MDAGDLNSGPQFTDGATTPDQCNVYYGTYYLALLILSYFSLTLNLNSTCFKKFIMKSYFQLPIF